MLRYWRSSFFSPLHRCRCNQWERASSVLINRTFCFPSSAQTFTGWNAAQSSGNFLSPSCHICLMRFLFFLLLIKWPGSFDFTNSCKSICLTPVSEISIKPVEVSAPHHSHLPGLISWKVGRNRCVINGFESFEVFSFFFPIGGARSRSYSIPFSPRRGGRRPPSARASA